MEDRQYMLRALRLALRGQGAVEPNPMVGCVLVRGGEILGEGWHQKFGGPHAEVAALADCVRRGNSPRGAHALVTLEPCCHDGKTGPCSQALIEAGVARVTAAMVDPFPKVAGGGVASLRAAGVNVEVGLCEAEARTVLAPFLKRVGTGLPWVIAKWAQTIDGKIATRTGDSKWISSEASRRIVHRLRARVDAVIVGVGTALADDPTLNARGVKIKRLARRVVVDPRLRLGDQSKLLNSFHGAGPVTIATSHESLGSARADALRRLGAEVVGLDQRADGRLRVAHLLKHLAEAHQATNVLVEGGAVLLGAVMTERLADELLVFVGPRVLGDAGAVSPVAGVACDRILDAQAFRLSGARALGDDAVLRYLASEGTR